MQQRSLQECLGLYARDKRMYLRQDEMAPIFRQVTGRDPSQSDIDFWAQKSGQVDASPDQYRQYLQGTPQGALGLAQQAQQMQVQANQPAIQTLQGQQTDLQSRYKDLLSSITTAEQPALNSAITATNNELGRRGITGDSGLGQNQIAQAQLPVAAQFGQLQANTGVAEQQDLGSLAAQIAQLQAGNVPNALNYASGISGQQTALQQTQLQSQTALQQAQIQAANNIATARLGNQFQNVAPGNNLVNTLNNYAINPSMLTSKNGGVANLNNNSSGFR